MSLYRKCKKALQTLLSCDKRWARALWLSVAPSLEHLSVLKLISVEFIVDIGANRGQFALAARHCFPEAVIQSFEPLPMPASVFRHVFAGDENVQLHESAIGPQLGRHLIHISASDDSSSLLAIGPEQSRLYPGTAEIGTSSVQVARLSDVLTLSDLRESALLKLDVQGFELSVLEACTEMLEKFSWIYCECSFLELYKGQALAHEVIAWLEKRQFVLNGIYNISYTKEGRSAQADFLFVKTGP